MGLNGRFPQKHRELQQLIREMLRSNRYALHEKIRAMYGEQSALRAWIQRRLNRKPR